MVLATSNQQKYLRVALAINRGIQMLDEKTDLGRNLYRQLNILLNPTAQNIPSTDNALYEIHKMLFQDWRQRDLETNSLAVDNNAKRTQVRNLMRDFLWAEETGILDKNNIARELTKTQLVDAIAKFYVEMVNIRPFRYGNHLTIEFLLTTLLNHPKFQAVYGNIIDFRRLTRIDAEKLHDSNPDISEVKAVIGNALDASKTPRLADCPEVKGDYKFESPSNNVKFIEGMPFLGYTLREGDEVANAAGGTMKINAKSAGEYVITINGGLVPIAAAEKAIQKNQEAGNLVSEIKGFKANLFLPDSVNYFRGKSEVDGVDIGSNGEAPLCCLDINMITGLRKEHHDRVAEVFRKAFPDKNYEFPFALNNHELLAKTLEVAGNDDLLKRSIKTAFERAGRVVNKMDRAADTVLRGLKPSDKPQFFMSMGGAGSGKGVVEEIAAAKCANNVAVATLDGFRDRSDLYHLLLAAKHHADDYRVVEVFASNLRDWVASRALANKINLMYDGSGIPYHGRYDSLIARYKNVGYETWVAAVDAPVGKAAKNVVSRMAEINRTLPWPVFADKHQGIPFSFMDAAADPNVDHLCLFSNDNKRGEHKLIATLDRDDDANSLVDARRMGRLSEAIYDGVSGKKGVLSLIGSHDSHLVNLSSNNVDLLAIKSSANHDSHVTALVVHDVRRFREMVGKGQLNKHANSIAKMELVPPTEVRFLVPSTNTGNRLF